MRKTFFISIVLLLIQNIYAEKLTIYGDIQEGFFGTSLPDVEVSIYNSDSTVNNTAVQLFEISASEYGGKSFSRYSTELPRNSASYFVKISLDGYDDEWLKFRIDDTSKDQIQLPLVSMFRRHMTELDEVTVKATKVKMFWRGDTIVYDATAFNLPDGSVLDNLIRQLPGAEIKDNGEIFVNGRKIDELLLGSRSFMRGKNKVLREHLPYYTVKNLKVYEKDSDLSEALGYEAEAKRYVMDVNLKMEYNMGLIGNMEAAGGTEKRWLGRAFFLGFTDRWRYSVIGNANNVNETRHIGESGYWTPATMPRNMTTTRSVAVEADYQSKDRKIKNNITAEYAHLITSTEMRQRNETFLQGMTPLSITEGSTLNKSYKISVKDNFTLNKPFYLSLQGSFNREKVKGHTNTSFTQWGDTLTARMLTSGFDESTATSGLLYITTQKALNQDRKQHVGISATAFLYDLTANNMARYGVEQNATNSITNNIDNILDRVNEFKVEGNYAQSLSRTWSLRSEISYDFRDRKAHDYLYHPDTITLPSQREMLAAFADPGNSYNYRYTKHTGTLTVSFVNSLLRQLLPGVNISSEQFNLKLEIPLMRQKLDYQRGALDTVASHNSLRINPSFTFTRKFGSGDRNEIRANAAFTTHDLDLLQTISYRDDSKPLIVTEGNDGLKARQTSTCSLDYALHNGPGKQEIGLSTRLDYSHRDIAQSVLYNPETGVYTYRPVNVGGGYIWTNNVAFSREIDKAHLWSVQSNTSAIYNHSLDQTMLSSANASILNIVNTWTLGERVFVQFSKGSLNVRATGDVNWRRSTGKMVDFQALSAVDFQYGMSARYTIPVLNTTVSADGTMYSRRGYGSSSLNTNDFVLNTSLSQSMLKGKLVARVEGFDLLHQLSQVNYEVNAQGRVETWYRSLPHYVMLHLIYNFSINPKKR